MGDGRTKVALRVIIVGGGFAGLEATVALRVLLGNQLALTLVSPDSTFAYRPLATAEVFSDSPPHVYDLGSIAADLHAGFHQEGLESVAPGDKQVRLGSGIRLAYDALVLGTGARKRGVLPGAITFRDQRDAPALRGLLDDMSRGVIRRLVFAVPSRNCWPLPAYELALFAAAHAERHHIDAEIAVVAPDDTPLEQFGRLGSRAVEELMTERGVQFVGGASPHAVRADGSLELELNGLVEADAVVTLPELVAQRIPGIPASWGGFVPTGSCGQVQGLSDVYAAGDMTAFPIKTGGLAAQQADRIAETLAAQLDVPVRFRGPGRSLQVRLLGGKRPLFLRAELDDLGHVVGASVNQLEPREVAVAAKVAARYLAPYLAGLEPAAAAAL